MSVLNILNNLTLMPYKNKALVRFLYFFSILVLTAILSQNIKKSKIIALQKP